jgi:hypothetical protein
MAESGQRRAEFVDNWCVGGQIAWPPNSPDLTPTDICVAGFS